MEVSRRKKWRPMMLRASDLMAIDSFSPFIINKLFRTGKFYAPFGNVNELYAIFKQQEIINFWWVSIVFPNHAKIYRRKTKRVWALLSDFQKQIWVPTHLGLPYRISAKSHTASLIFTQHHQEIQKVSHGNHKKYKNIETWRYSCLRLSLSANPLIPA